MKRYSAGRDSRSNRGKRVIVGLTAALVIGVGGWFLFHQFTSSGPEKVASRLQFDSSVTEAEKQQISQAIAEQIGSVGGDIQVSVQTSLEVPDTNSILSAYAPVTGRYAVRQSIESGQFAGINITMPGDVEEIVKNTVAESIGVDAATITAASAGEPSDAEIWLIPASSITPDVKLLRLNDAYYLDSFTKGAVFRQVVFTGEATEKLSQIPFNNLPTKDAVLKVNTTGVTALTRLMMRKLSSVGDPTFFSEKIGPVLADADITHVSNEVSFREGCQYNNALFCSPPEFIETLKDSGVDLVELTGNHNNDNGSVYNTESIELYHSLGMATFGGGLNSSEAAKPYLADKKGSKIAFLGYNMADGMGSGAIAGDTTAGANYYTEEKARADIAAAKQSSQFVVVHIQYAECQAYPAGYMEFPECDGPISGQQAAFRKMVDLGADMVVGSSAHQPQTHEFYNGKPIYYGLGNLYFEQTQWPGTERGIVLSSYFMQGKLVQTRLLPTVYDRNYQPRLMTDEEAEFLLDRLRAARY